MSYVVTFKAGGTRLYLVSENTGLFSCNEPVGLFGFNLVKAIKYDTLELAAIVASAYKGAEVIAVKE